MTDNAIEHRAIGNIAKIIAVDEDGENMHFRLQDGRTGRAGIFSDASPHVGDIILVGDQTWEFAPKELWHETNAVSVVLRVIDDSILVEFGITTRIVRNPNAVRVRSGNTIEYNEDEGVIRVISDAAIRSGGHELDLESVRAQYLLTDDDEALTFDDFGGYPEVKNRALELIDTQLERQGHLKEIKARPVKGILFSGPPGTGKTHLARIIAHQAKADFYLVSGPEIISKWLGDTEDTLRKIFRAAEESKSGRAIIFFDEIDSIAERRSSDSHESSRRLVGQLLTQMDGFGENDKNIIVIAATNRAESLDPALTRPGRFDWEIEFGMPTLADRLEILIVRASKLRTSDDLPLEDIARLSEGWSAADLTVIWTEAALITAGDDRKKITAEDVAQAFERVASKPRRAIAMEKKE